MQLLQMARSLAHSQRFRQFLLMGFCLLICVAPSFAQFAGGTTQVDPTAGAQQVARYIVDGLLYVVAAAAAVCFCWGLFRLFSRPLEGIMEVAVGLIVLGIIGHLLGWASALTGVTVG